jgi:hypothetical protein
MARLRLFPVVLLLAACAAPTPSPTAVPPPTDTRPPAATRTPSSTRTPTEEAIPPEVAAELEAIHMGLFLIQVDAEVVAEAATRMVEGELDQAGLDGVFTNLQTYAQTVNQIAMGVHIPDEVSPAWEEALDAHSETMGVIGAWTADEIEAEDVLEQIEPIRASAAHAVQVGWEAIAGMVGVDPSEMERILETALAEIIPLAFEPPPEVYGCGEGETEEARAGLVGRIAFVSDRDGDPEIYVANADGTDETRLTESAGGDYHPVWSPDGSQIAFYSERDGNAEIYIMGADGSEVTRLTNHSANDYDPAWSPDGSQIAFHTHRYGQNAMVAVMNVDGSSVRRLTPDDIGGWSPDWSPEGDRIVFNSVGATDRDIWVVDADGTGFANMTNGRGDDWWPDWSPDGTQIVFHSVRDGNFEIYVISADGGGATRLTESPAGDYDAAWSRDGAWVVFTSDAAGNREVCAMSADGTLLANVTDHPANDWAADWGP